MYKVGIGITTTPNRRLHPNVYKYAAENSMVVVNNDTEGMGVSRSRNLCIKALYDAGCDFIFLFDDDCYPMHPGWENYFINAHIKSGIHHFCIPEAFKAQQLSSDGEISYFNSAIGCFRFMSRRLVEEVGYFNTAYNRYGFEDAGYNIRAKKSGLYGEIGQAYPTPSKSVSYIFSEDVYALNPTPNLSMEKKMEFIAENRPKYSEEISGTQIYYPYEQ